jgi:hypothetical protein
MTTGSNAGGILISQIMATETRFEIGFRLFLVLAAVAAGPRRSQRVRQDQIAAMAVYAEVASFMADQAVFVMASGFKSVNLPVIQRMDMGLKVLAFVAILAEPLLMTDRAFARICAGDGPVSA